MPDPDYPSQESVGPAPDSPSQKSTEPNQPINTRLSGLATAMRELRPLVLAALAFFGSFTGAEVSENSRNHERTRSEAPYVIVVETTNPSTVRLVTFSTQNDERSKDLKETTREAASQAKEHLAEQNRSKLEQTETPKTETVAAQQASPRPTPSPYKTSPGPTP
jgi:hypothetical protein